MNNERGVTLVTVIIIIILLIIFSGFVITQGSDTFQKSRVARFEANMKMIQKKVDIIVEEKEEIPGLEMTDEIKGILQQIIDEDNSSNNFIETNDVDEPLLRYFSPEDIETQLGVQDVRDDIVVNFSNREIISLQGVKRGENKYYVEKGLH